MGALVLSNMQKELLKLYSTEIPDSQLQEIKYLLSNYFADKASDEMDRLGEENKWDDQTMNQWANEQTGTRIIIDTNGFITIIGRKSPNRSNYFGLISSMRKQRDFVGI